MTPAVYSLGAQGQPHWMTQPRVPAGSSEGGQWTTEAGTSSGETPNITLTGSSESELTGLFIDLLQHETDVDHTLKDHVGKSDDTLLQATKLRQLVAQGKYRATRELPEEGIRVGSFSSLEAANKLIASTLRENSSEVLAVSTGMLGGAQLSKRFQSATGKEAYAPSLWGPATIRDTFGVKVVIRHDRTMPLRFRIHTAFPTR